MKRVDAKRLADLRDAEELARLEIETLRAKDITTLDVETLTAGQLIVLADLINALNVFRTMRDTLTEAEPREPVGYNESDFVSSRLAEKRVQTPFGGFPKRSESPFLPQYGDTPDEVETEEGRQAAEDAIARLRSILSGVIPADQEVMTVNGPIKYGDVPRDESGNLAPGWLDANCTCEEHEAARRNNVQNSDAFPTGQYL